MRIGIGPARADRRGRARGRIGIALRAVALVGAVALVLCAGAAAEQGSQPGSAAAGQLDAGAFHTCAVLGDGNVRCWGFGGEGRLGYGNTNTIGDDETPASVRPVDLGTGRTATAITAGDAHTCAILDDGTVRCWGFGASGRLGYGNTTNVGDAPASTPDKLGPVNLGGAKATAITAGSAHTCAILEDGTVRCWGFGASGQLGYGNTSSVGDTPARTPDKAGAVNLAGHKATAIAAGSLHTCAIVDDGSLWCWGLNANGQLGYGNTTNVGDTPASTPDKVGPVNLGGAKATAITAGSTHTCAILEDGTVRCWGFGFSGQLGYGNTNNAGDTPASTPDKLGAVNLGGHKATAITAGSSHTCAVLDDRTVRCWGNGIDGRLGYANTRNLGNTPATTPDKLGPVDLGTGQTAAAISAGENPTCARLDQNAVRCWGNAANGALGYCNTNNIGDSQTPGSAGPVNLQPGDGGAGCPTPAAINPPAPSSPAPSIPAPPVKGLPTTSSATGPADDGSRAQASRARHLRGCLAGVTSHAKGQRRLARHGSARRRAAANHHLSAHARSGRRRCLHLYARTPGPVRDLRAQTTGTTQIQLSFNAPGTDANHPPPARSYLVKQSRHPIPTNRAFARAQTLCHGACRFTIAAIGDKITLTVTDLRPHTTYYYAIAARDNVSAKQGPRSQTVTARTG